MPRLDNGLPAVIAWFQLEYDPDDPGATPPVDVCKVCYRRWKNEGGDVDHPDYEDIGRTCVCAMCGKVLTEVDN